MKVDLSRLKPHELRQRILMARNDYGALIRVKKDRQADWHLKVLQDAKAELARRGLSE